jgi:hypothetical protein
MIQYEFHVVALIHSREFLNLRRTWVQVESPPAVDGDPEQARGDSLPFVKQFFAEIMPAPGRRVAGAAGASRTNAKGRTACRS